ncbi:MAG: hypothetical protein V4557_10545 [Bacteroidota bacterium]
MAQDYIMIRKQRNADNYLLLVYFSQHKGSITIPLSNDDFSRMIKAGNAILGQHRIDEKIMMPEGWTASDYNGILDKVLTHNNDEYNARVKPAANVIIFIPDKRVDYKVTDLLAASAIELLNEMGFLPESEEAPLYGSFLQRSRFSYAKSITNEDLGKVYQKTRKALELANTPVDEQAERLVKAAGQLIRNMDGVKEGIIQLGELMVLKKMVDGETRTIIKQLLPEMVVLLEKQPDMILSFRAMYELLTGDIKGLPALTERPGITS